MRSLWKVVGWDFILAFGVREGCGQTGVWRLWCLCGAGGWQLCAVRVCVCLFGVCMIVCMSMHVCVGVGLGWGLSPHVMQARVDDDEVRRPRGEVRTNELLCAFEVFPWSHEARVEYVLYGEVLYQDPPAGRPGRGAPVTPRAGRIKVLTIVVARLAA